MHSIAPTSAQSAPAHTESSPTDSTYFTATHHAESITTASPFTVPDDFSNKANFTNATTDTDSLNPG